MVFWRIHVISVAVIFFAPFSWSWRHDRRPKLFGDQVPNYSVSTKNRIVQQKIVSIHNFFRANVQPRASNMLEVSWHNVAAEAAQRWSDECHLLLHNNDTDRSTKLFGTCGQNIFVATHKVPWHFAIKSWYLEYANFTYNSDKNNLGIVGHYTQMVWATSHKLGCGFSKCKTSSGKTFFNYICNYCPIGNFMNDLGTPYAKGEPCADCPNACNVKSGLCTNSCPFGDFWTNCSEMNQEWHKWLCLDKSTEGRNRRNHCRATCSCRNKILPKYSLSKPFAGVGGDQNVTVTTKSG